MFFRMTLAVSACLLVFSTNGASQTTSGCNNTSRHADITAGYHNSANVPCSGTFSISVAGQSFNSPTECQLGYAYYAGTVYVCEGSVQDIDCNPEGFKVDISLAQGGSCPDITGLVTGDSWDSWDDVPQAISNALHCNPPNVTQTFDWSAKTKRCQVGVHESEPAGETIHAEDGSTYVAWEGDPGAWLPASTSDPFSTPYDAAQTAAPSEIDPLLSAVASSSAAIEAVDLIAEVSITHLSPSPSSQTAQITGQVRSDGTFDVRETVLAEKDGEHVALVRRVLCDGRALARIDDEAEAALAWVLGSDAATDVLPLVTRFVSPLDGWVRSPYGIPLFSTIAYESDVQADGSTVIRRVRKPATGLSTEEYVVGWAGETPIVREARIRDASGRVVVQSVFGDPHDLGDGQWRPFTAVRRLFLHAGQAEPDIEVSVRLVRATATHPAAPIGLPVEPDREWSIWP